MEQIVGHFTKRLIPLIKIVMRRHQVPVDKDDLGDEAPSDDGENQRKQYEDEDEGVNDEMEG